MIRGYFVGIVCSDTKMVETAKGTAACNFSIACRREAKMQQETTQFVQCCAWGQMAEICGKYVKKGAKLFVTGKDISINTFKDKAGKFQARMKTSVVDVVFLSDGKNEEKQEQHREQARVQETEEEQGRNFFTEYYMYPQYENDEM